MRLTRLFTEKRAGSSVIAIVLMVATAVILGGAVSAYALGVVGDANTAVPQASFEFETNDATGDIIVTQTGGDTLDGDQLRFSGAALDQTSYGSITEWSGGDVEVGDSTTVNVESGERLTITWQSPENDDTATIAEYDVPSGVGPTASIGNVETFYSTHISDGKVTVENVEFSRVENDSVYVVVDDDPTDGIGSPPDASPGKGWVSTSGGDVTVYVTPSVNINSGETLTVTVYETDSESRKLATETTTA